MDRYDAQDASDLDGEAIEHALVELFFRTSSLRQQRQVDRWRGADANLVQIIAWVVLEGD